jgi:hypothetical protein
MLINEMLEQQDYKKPELGYDLKEDLICFMRNDPDFYRKEYFPVMHKFKNYVQAGKRINPMAFEGLVNKAYECYQNMFPVEGLESKLSNEMCEDLCKELHKSETDYVNAGHYDNE